MICTFMNFHEKENEKNLEKHLTREIEIAIGRGCSVFLTGMRYPEDEIFAEKVKEAAKFYAEGEVVLKTIEKGSEEELKNFFMSVADYELYPYEVLS